MADRISNLGLSIGATAARASLGLTKQVAVAQNPFFGERISPVKIQEILPTRRKIVIVAQNPPPGGDVPLGTVVNLTLALKDDLPMSSLGALPLVAQKWQNAALVEAAVDKAPVAVKNILASQVDFADLADSDRQVVDTFLTQQITGLAPADTAKAFNDVKFAFQL